MLIRRNDLLHEEQIAVEIVGEKENGEKMVDIRPDELLGLDPLIVVLIELLGNESILSRNGEVPHRKVKNLS
jgi:hypothetical protein